MKLSNAMALNAVITGLFGLAFLIFPAVTTSFYGVTSNEPLEYMARLWGCALLGYAILAWTCRNVIDPSARRGILVAMAFSNAAGFIVTLLATVAGVVNVLGWVTVVLSGVFALYYLFIALQKRVSEV